ncbi:membrane protein insertase YidC [Streptococcus caprae]|uniref:Membrane protein insertase YidC n=1 Tax=Streptococcus caprae TaxID=1640501 RepID=A0ABV8CX18_9STRE
MTKQFKRLLLTGFGLSFLLLLSGCVQTKNGVPTGEGWVYNLLVAPMGEVIQYFAENKGLGYGIAIIIVTIIVRLFIILPLGLYQSWKSTYQTERRNYLSYIFEPINKRMQDPNATQEEKLMAQQELLAAQKEYGISMFGGIGCLPLLIQMPFFSALFYAARYTEGIAGSKFLWFQLDKAGDIPLIIIIAALYFFQAWLSMKTIPEEQRAQMKTTMYMTPLMMVYFAWISPAGVALYWLVGGIFSVIQQIIVMMVIKPMLKKKVEAEFIANPPKPYKPMARTTAAAARRDVTNTPSAISEPGRNRNAGKQRSRK